MGRPADAIYLALKSAIQTGQLAPGAHLVEDTLREQYQVSRTLVRNALRRLSDEGLVTIEANRGAFVASWTSDDAAEVMAIRAMLEPYAAQLAAQRRTSGQLDQLIKLCDAMEACERIRGDRFRDELARQNHELHQLVLECAASPRLYNIAANLTRAPSCSARSSSTTTCNSSGACRTTGNWSPRSRRTTAPRPAPSWKRTCGCPTWH